MTDLKDATLAERIAGLQARAIDQRALATLFLDPRAALTFLPQPVPHELLLRCVEVAELGPTSANSLPVRYVFVESAAEKAKLEPSLSSGNHDKTMAAPVTAIVAADLLFYERLPETYPARPDMKKFFEGPENIDGARAFARDNALLQMGYFLLTLRAFGLDFGAMGGFKRELVDAAFFPEGRWISLFLVNIGYSDGTTAGPRPPRLRPDEIVRFV
jgi:3-hydroxypropanoate dehydrogenase